MKKILIEDGLSLKLERGIGQYTNNLYKLLKDDYIVEMPRKTILERINNSVIRRLLYILWLNTIFLLKLSFNKNISICFFPAVVTPIIKLKKVKYISVIHDVRSKEHPELSTKIQNLHIDFANWSALNFADKVLTVSNTMKKDISKYYNVKESNIGVIYNTFSLNNIDYDKTENILKKTNIQTKKYLLFVGGLDKNKNINLVISAFEKISNNYENLKLIIVGRVGNDKISSNNPNIIMTGFISSKDLKVLYRNALAYLFPSLYEGFGIPIIDAQAFGVPVICSDIPVFREVAGDGALFCELNTKSFAKELEKILEDDELRNSLILKGNENQKRFSVENIKEQLKSCLEQMS